MEKTAIQIFADEDFKIDAIVYVDDDGKAVKAKGNVKIDSEGSIIFPSKVTFADDCVMEWGIGNPEEIKKIKENPPDYQGTCAGFSYEIRRVE